MEKMECYLVEVNGLYFVCEEKPTMMTNLGWQTDGSHVELPFFIAEKIIRFFKETPKKDLILDIADTSILF